MAPLPSSKLTGKPGKTQVRKRRVRNMTLGAALRQAVKAGQPAKSAEVYPDHFTLTFSGDDKAPMTPLEKWKAKRNAR